MKNILYVGVDVDDKNFTGATFSEHGDEQIAFKTRPNAASLLKKLKEFQNKGYELKVCYEATYIGYSLYDDLQKAKISCEVVAPSLIPSVSGKQVKTDKLDSLKLAKYYAKGLLTAIYIPDKEDLQVRNFIRTRSFLVKQLGELKKHILSECRQYNLNYKNESAQKYYWTIKHLNWLKSKIKELPNLVRTNFEILLEQMEEQAIRISECEKYIQEIAETPKYKKKKDILNTFKGIDTLRAMTLITEIGDIKRFSHPNKLVSYSGMDIREYSSGGKENKFGITRMGNKRIRTTVVEACQNSFSTLTIGRRLKAAQKGQDQRIIDVSNRCIKRLRKKSLRMMHNGKHTNKIKVACAREMLCFIWEVLQIAV